MPERVEVLLWAAVGDTYSRGSSFVGFEAAFTKPIKVLEFDISNLIPFQLAWKSYGKRLVVEVLSNDQRGIILINLSQFGQVSTYY